MDRPDSRIRSSEDRAVPIGDGWVSAFTEEQLSEYRKQIAESINDHGDRITALEERIIDGMVVGEDALDVLYVLLRDDKEGMADPVKPAVLRDHLPHLDDTQFSEAVGELQHLGLVQISKAISVAIANMRPTIKAYVAFDHVATGHNTQEDALALAQMWLDDYEALNLMRLQPKLAWEFRRLNPAVMALLPLIDPQHWSRENRYPFFKSVCSLMVRTDTA